MMKMKINYVKMISKKNFNLNKYFFVKIYLKSNFNYFFNLGFQDMD